MTIRAPHSQLATHVAPSGSHSVMLPSGEGTPRPWRRENTSEKSVSPATNSKIDSSYPGLVLSRTVLAWTAFAMSLVGRVARQLAAATGSAQRAGASRQIAQSQRRSFASGHGEGTLGVWWPGREGGRPALLTVPIAHPAGSGHDVTYAGLTLHPPSKWHSMVGHGMAGVMW